MLEVTMKDTIPFIMSNDANKRLQGEYWQARIRYENLLDWCSKKGFNDAQLKRLNVLSRYLHSLRIDAAQAGVSLLDEFLRVKNCEPCEEDVNEGGVEEDKSEEDEDEEVNLDSIAPGMNKVVNDFFDNVYDTLNKAKGARK